MPDKSLVGFRLKSKSDMFKYLDFNPLQERVAYKQTPNLAVNLKTGK